MHEIGMHLIFVGTVVPTVLNNRQDQSPQDIRTSQIDLPEMMRFQLLYSFPKRYNHISFLFGKAMVAAEKPPKQL